MVEHQPQLPLDHPRRNQIAIKGCPTRHRHGSWVTDVEDSHDCLGPTKHRWVDPGETGRRPVHDGGRTILRHDRQPITEQIHASGPAGVGQADLAD